jgi:hypothetical protein
MSPLFQRRLGPLESLRDPAELSRTMAAFLISFLVIAGIIGFGAIVMALAEIMADGPETSETRSGATEGSHREQDS